MKILYLAHRVPYPPDKGDKIRSFRQLEHLAKRHRVWCACFVDAAADRTAVARLRDSCEEVRGIRLRRGPATARGLWGLVSGGTVTESFYQRSSMESALRRWYERIRFDVVVAFSSSMAGYALQVPAGRRVLDLCDLDSRKWLDYAAASTGPIRYLYALEGTRLGSRERTWMRAFDATLVITEAEALPLRRFVAAHKLYVVGNGVFLPDAARHPLYKALHQGKPKAGGMPGLRGATVSVMSNGRTTHAVKRRPPAPRDPPSDLLASDHGAPTEACGRLPPTVGFVGVMDYRPNVDAVRWFVSACWPGIRAAHHGAVFRIVGRAPTRAVRRLAAVRGVEVTGGVDDAAVELARFDVSVAPMRIARGLQNKVLEAMAAAKPMVLTSVAARGIGACPGRAYLIADQPREFIEAVLRLLRSSAERARLGSAARRFVARHHRWEAVLGRFERIVIGTTCPILRQAKGGKSTVLRSVSGS